MGETLQEQEKEEGDELRDEGETREPASGQAGEPEAGRLGRTQWGWTQNKER